MKDAIYSGSSSMPEPEGCGLELHTIWIWLNCARDAAAAADRCARTTSADEHLSALRDAAHQRNSEWRRFLRLRMTADFTLQVERDVAGIPLLKTEILCSWAADINMTGFTSFYYLKHCLYVLLFKDLNGWMAFLKSPII